MELLRNCIFFFWNVKLSKSQMQNTSKSLLVKPENFSAHLLSHLRPTFMGKRNDNYSLPLNPACSQELQRELLFKTIFICSDFNPMAFWWHCEWVISGEKTVIKDYCFSLSREEGVNSQNALPFCHFIVQYES